MAEGELTQLGARDTHAHIIFFCFIIIRFQTIHSIQMYYSVHFNRPLPVLSKFRFKHITQMFTFSRKIQNFQQDIQKLVLLVCGLKSSYSKTKALTPPKKASGVGGGYKRTYKFQRQWKMLHPPKLICVRNQSIFLVTSFPRLDLLAYSAWYHTNDELFIPLTTHRNSWCGISQDFKLQLWVKRVLISINGIFPLEFMTLSCNFHFSLQLLPLCYLYNKSH